MKKLILFLVAFACSCAYGQSPLVRYDSPFPSVSSITPPFLVANLPPNSPTLAVCGSPANAVPCTNYVSTFQGNGGACSNGSQDTPQPALTSSCQSTGDAEGNIGFWAPAGKYDYTVCISNNCFGPFTVTLGGSGGGGSSGIPAIIPTATGNGTTDDTAALNSATNSCPQSGTTVGCLVYLPCGHFKTTATWNIALLKGVHIMGGGTDGTGGACSIIQTNGAIDGMTIGNGTNPNSSGFQMDNVAFQDMTGNGSSAVHIEATRDALLTNVAAYNYSVGAGFKLDGGVNFTQFITIDNPYTWMTKFGIQTVGKTASIYVHGGELNCQNAGSTDVISGSIGMDLGYTFNTASTGTASEWVITTQTQNCQIGRALFNAGGNKFLGDKADEININARPNLSFGVIVTGDTASLANGNSFVNEQITKAGTGFYLAPLATNTIIDNPVFNGTNGVDIVQDSVSYSTTRLTTVKALTGWTTNVSACTRSSNVVLCTTTASSDNGNLSVLPGTLITLFNSTGGATSFNGTFPLVSVATNDATGITTLTWAQTGGNESATINGGACGGAGTCVVPSSTVLNSGVGVLAITGEQITQNQTFQGVSNCPILSLGGTATPCFDGTYFDLIENNGGVLHLSDGPSIRLTGTTSNKYTPQPTTTAGYGVAGVPNCSALITPNPQTATVCPSSDDKGKAAATNTNGTSICLPPPGTANGYPPNYSWSPSFAPSTGPNFLSITPPGTSSLYGQVCSGTAATLDGLSTARNLSIQQGVTLWTDGNNWFTEPGNPSIPLDQIAAALSNVNIDLAAGSWVGSTSAGNNGGSVTLTGGNTNDTTGQAGSSALQTGHAPASGKNGYIQIIQTFEAGASTTGKEGNIARLCNNFSADCSASLPVSANAVRITISDTGDTGGAIGIIFAGASIGNPTDVQIAGIYPSAISENSCTPNEYFLISQVSSSVNGRGYCSGSDSPLRIGYTTGSTSGTCNTSTPCTVPILILPAGSNSGGGGGSFVAGGDLSGSSTSQQVVGLLGKSLPGLATGFLNYTGSVLAFSPAIASVTINNGTGITGGATGSTFTLGLVAPAVLTTVTNTYTAGAKQVFSPSATTAGLNFGSVTVDPSGLAGGDIWFRTDLNQLRFYDGAATQTVMNISNLVTLAQLNDGTPSNGTEFYESGGVLAQLRAGCTGCVQDMGGSSTPQWDTNLVFSAGNFSVNGTVTANKFIGLGPYRVDSICPSGTITPTSGQTSFGVNSDCNWYLNNNGGAFGQVVAIPGGAVAADQIAVGLSAGVYAALTFPACADTGGNHLNYTHGGGITCGTSGGGGSGVITGYCDTTKQVGANVGVRIAACLATSGILVADASGDTPGTLTQNLVISSTTGQVVILPPGTIAEGSGFTVNISGNHNMLECNEWRDCILDGSVNGSLGTINISSGKDNHIIGVSVKGGGLTEQVGTEVSMSGEYHSFEHGAVDFPGTFGEVHANCYRCKSIDVHINHSIRAARNVNTNVTALSAMTGSGTTATATTTGASLIGTSGNQVEVLIASCSDTTYNGQFQATSTGSSAFTYTTLTSVVSGTPTGCTYTIPSVGNEFLDGKGSNDNDVDTGDAVMGITSSGVLGGTTGTIVRGMQITNDLPACNGDTTGATALGATLAGNGTTITATVSAGVAAPNALLLTSPVASQVIFTGISSGGLANATPFTVASTGATTFTITNANCNTTCGGTITFVVVGHGTNAHGCSEMYQETDKAVNTLYDGNYGLNSYREMYVLSSYGNRVTNNYCENPNLIAGGNGCYMQSVSHNGGLEAGGFFGDTTWQGNTALLSNSNTTSYGFSVQLGANVTNMTARNDVIANNVIESTGGGTWATGLRICQNSSAGTLTESNLDFHDNMMTSVTAATQYSTGSGCNNTTVGAPISGNNSTLDSGTQGFPMMFGSGANVSASTTNFFGVGLVGATEVAVQVPVTRAGTVSNLYCVGGTAYTGSTQHVITVRHGTYSGQTVTQNSTSLTCTLNSTNSHWCNDTTAGHAFTVAPTDVLDIQTAPSNTPPAQPIACTVTFQ